MSEKEYLLTDSGVEKLRADHDKIERLERVWTMLIVVGVLNSLSIIVLTVALFIRT